MVRTTTAAPPAEADPGRIGAYQELPIDSIQPSPFNRRCGDDDPRTLALAESLRQDGLMQPIVVRPLADGLYEIVCGERRWRAARRNGWHGIRCGIIDCDAKEASILRFVENAQRLDLSPLEEGDGVAAMLEMFEGDVSEVAARLKWKEPWVRRRARIPHLTPEWRAELADPATVYAHIRDSVERLEEVAVLPPETQNALLAGGELRYKRTTRDLRQAIALLMRRIDVKPWTREWERKTFSSGRRCDACRKRSGSKDGGLFDALVEAAAEEAKDKSDLCLDPACWRERTILYVKSQLADHPGASLLADGPVGGEEEEKIFGGTILSKWEWEECVENRQLPPAYTIEAKGVFVAGNRLGKVVDIMLREDARDREEDAERAERLRQARRDQEEGERRRQALLRAIDEALPAEGPETFGVLLAWSLWFGLGSGAGYDQRFDEWNVVTLVWRALRADVAEALETEITRGYGDVYSEDIEEQNHAVVMTSILHFFKIEPAAVKARAEELLHAPAD